MAIYQMTYSTRVVVSTRDPAIDTAAEGCDVAKYRSTLNRSHLRFNGSQPTLFTIAPLRPGELDECELESFASIDEETSERPGSALIISNRQHRQAFARGCKRIENFLDAPVVQLNGALDDDMMGLLPDVIVREIGGYILRMTNGDAALSHGEDVGK